MALCMYYAKGEKNTFFIKGLTSFSWNTCLQQAQKNYDEDAKLSCELSNQTNVKQKCKDGNHSMGDVLDMMDMQVQNP